MTKKTTKKAKKPTKSEKKAETRRAGMVLLTSITRDLYSLKEMVRKGEVCGVGCGDVDDVIGVIGKISNRVSLYSW